MRMTIITCAAALALSSPVVAGEKDWATASDIGVYSLSAVAIGLPLAKGDKKGALQAAGSIAANELLTLGAKEAFPEWRPDRSDRKSFPSGHTSQAFASAATLYNRNGAKIGIPAFAVASFVGLARVKADKHHWYDVVAGAGLGAAVGLLITKKLEEAPKSALMPWIDSKGGGISFAARF